MTPFPTPASSNAACGFPALRFPAHFVSRVMRPIALRPLSTIECSVGLDNYQRVQAVHTSTVYSTASSRFSLRLDIYPSPQFLQIDGCLYHLTPASHLVEGFMCSRVPSLHGRYPASPLSGRRRRAVALASVRRSNWPCGFPATSFHKGSLGARFKRRNQ